MLFLDYLDHSRARSHRNFNIDQKAVQLRIDMLAFPDTPLLVAAPAIAKCPDTAFVLGEARSLWSSGRISLVLPGRHRRFEDYVEERIERLRWSLPPSEFANSPEVVGYLSSHWGVLLRRLRDEAAVGQPFVSRATSCDAEFRRAVLEAVAAEALQRELYSNCAMGHRILDRVAADVSEMATEEDRLFQRDAILAGTARHRLPPIARACLAKTLDVAFATANAKSSGAALASSARARRAVAWLLHLLSLNGSPVPEVLGTLSTQQVERLARSRSWQAIRSRLLTPIPPGIASVELRRAARTVSRRAQARGNAVTTALTLAGEVATAGLPGLINLAVSVAWGLIGVPISRSLISLSTSDLDRDLLEFLKEVESAVQSREGSWIAREALRWSAHAATTRSLRPPQ